MESPHDSDDNFNAVSQASLEEHKSAIVENVETIESDIEAHENEQQYKQQDEQNEDTEETLVERLNLLRPNNPYRSLDERAHTVRKLIQEKFKNTPKTVLEETEEKKPEIEKRLEKNEKELSDLLTYGNEIITNIKVASEKRELLRREFETNQRVELENGISKETTEAMANYNDIKARWSELGELEEPAVLFNKMQEQHDSVVDLMRNKDDMIAKCQNEIDRMSSSFEEQLYHQQAEICSMVERVNAQIGLMKNAYSHRLNLLSDALDDERQTITLKEQEKWKQFYNAAQDSELYKLEMTKQKKQFYTDEIQRITTQQEEITRSTRIRLEKDSEMLLHELRCTKNQMLFNSEKLDYNYQVLQKRNEENVVINNQQKRRVGKLNEALVAIKKLQKSAEKNEENTISKLTNEIQKLHDSITDLEEKNERFHIHNRKKFVRVWDVNFEELKSLIERVFDIDRILNEQQLGLPWQKPKLSVEEFDLVKKEKAALFGDSKSLKSVSSKNTDEQIRQQLAPNASTSSAFNKTDQIFKRHQRDTFIRKAEEEQRLTEQRLEKRLLRNILRKVADRGDFLVEDRLLAFLEPYTEEQKALVRIDNIFAALRITDMPAVNRLVEFFKPYAWCPNCMEGIPREQLKKLYHSCPLASICSPDDDDDNILSRSDIDSDDESIGGNKASTSRTKELVFHQPELNSDSNLNAGQCDKHFLMVESAMVLTALSEFTNQETKTFEEDNQRLNALRASKALSETSGIKLRPKSLIDVNDEVIRQYWRKFLDYMPEEKLKLWKSLEHGLHHYLDVLKQREQLDKECAALRKQNAELKHLTQKFQL